MSSDWRLHTRARSRVLGRGAGHAGLPKRRVPARHLPAAAGAACGSPLGRSGGGGGNPSVLPSSERFQLLEARFSRPRVARGSRGRGSSIVSAHGRVALFGVLGKRGPGRTASATREPGDPHKGADAQVSERLRSAGARSPTGFESPSHSKQPRRGSEPPSSSRNPRGRSWGAQEAKKVGGRGPRPPQSRSRTLPSPDRSPQFPRSPTARAPKPAAARSPHSPPSLQPPTAWRPRPGGPRSHSPGPGASPRTPSFSASHPAPTPRRPRSPLPLNPQIHAPSLPAPSARCAHSPATPVAAARGADAGLGVAVLLQSRGRERVEEAGGQCRPAQAAASPGQQQRQPHLAGTPRPGRTEPAAPRRAERGAGRAATAAEARVWGRPRLSGAAFSNSPRWARRRQWGRGAPG